MEKFVKCSQAEGEERVEDISNELMRFIKEGEFIELGLEMLLSQDYSK